MVQIRSVSSCRNLRNIGYRTLTSSTLEFKVCTGKIHVELWSKFFWHLLKLYEGEYSHSPKQQSDLLVGQKPQLHTHEKLDVPFAHSPTDRVEAGSLSPTTLAHSPDFLGTQSDSQKSLLEFPKSTRSAQRGPHPQRIQSHSYFHGSKANHVAFYLWKVDPTKI